MPHNSIPDNQNLILVVAYNLIPVFVLSMGNKEGKQIPAKTHQHPNHIAIADNVFVYAILRILLSALQKFGECNNVLQLFRALGFCFFDGLRENSPTDLPRKDSDLIKLFSIN